MKKKINEMKKNLLKQKMKKKIFRNQMKLKLKIKI